MTYLSLVPIHEVRRSGTRRDTPDVRHREVMELFGRIDSDSPRSSAGVLFRVDIADWQVLSGSDRHGTGSVSKVPVYLIRSKVPPEFAKPSMITREETDTVPTEGSAVQFRIAVNGIERVDRDKARPTRRDGEPPKGPDDRSLTISQWLQKRLDGALKDIKISNHQREVLGADRHGRHTNSGKVIQIDTIDGIATVDAQARLIELLENGVGRAKSYGCGLLTIREI